MTDAKVYAFPGTAPPTIPAPPEPEPFNFLGWVYDEVVGALTDMKTLVEDAETLDQETWFAKAAALKTRMEAWPNG